jgi:hypothetical protein
VTSRLSTDQRDGYLIVLPTGCSGRWAEDFSDALEVQICEAILAREKTGDSFPDRNAVEAMEEPLHRLTGAAVLHDQL